MINRLFKASKIIFYILVVGTFATLFLGVKILPDEDVSTYDDVSLLDAEWYYRTQDGEYSPVEIPIEIDVPRGNKISFICQLPEVENNKSLVFRTSKQNIKVSINGVLREDYNIVQHDIFANTSVSAYMYVPINKDDSYRQLEVEVENPSKDEAVLKSVFYGNELDIFANLGKNDGITLIAALVVLVSSLLVIVICGIIKIKVGMQSSLIYLAYGTVLVCTWLITQSTLRQVMFRNISVMGDMTYRVMMLIPIPFLIYINTLQKNRYKTWYTISIMLSGLVYIVSNLICMYTSMEFSELIPMTWSGMGFACIMTLICSFVDIRRGLAKDYQLVLIGFMGMIATTFFQMYSYVHKIGVLSGLGITIGLVFLLMMAGVKALNDYGIFVQEKNKLKREVKEKDYKIEKLSQEILDALAQSIDAKDHYTNGHSFRVAQYALLLAQKLEMTEEVQHRIYYAALMHDIGKIGIPDEVLNKKTKLTHKEYDIIKTHTTIGYSILKHIEEIPEIEYGARWHHERYDGKGYPDRLKGEQIPLNIRIIAIVDAYDAMTSTRVYSGTIDQAYVRNEIENGRGMQFDPELVDLMLELIDNHELEALM